MSTRSSLSPFGVLHTSALSLYAGLAIGNMIYAATALSDMPAVVGYHFSESGGFDLYGSKYISFLHPIIAEIILLALFALLIVGAYRARPLKRLTPAGNRRLTTIGVALLDLLSLLIVALFSHWIYCVANQTPLHTDLVLALSSIAAIAIALYAFIIFVTIILARMRQIRAKGSEA